MLTSKGWLTTNRDKDKSEDCRRTRYPWNKYLWVKEEWTINNLRMRRGPSTSWAEIQTFSERLAHTGTCWLLKGTGCSWSVEVTHCCLRALWGTRAADCQRRCVLWGVTGAHVHGSWAPAVNKRDVRNPSDRGQKPEGRHLATLILRGELMLSVDEA